MREDGFYWVHHVTHDWQIGLWELGCWTLSGTDEAFYDCEFDVICHRRIDRGDTCA